jgi:hypothetical protein
MGSERGDGVTAKVAVVTGAVRHRPRNRLAYAKGGLLYAVPRLAQIRRPPQPW